MRSLTISSAPPNGAMVSTTHRLSPLFQSCGLSFEVPSASRADDVVGHRAPEHHADRLVLVVEQPELLQDHRHDAGSGTVTDPDCLRRIAHSRCNRKLSPFRARDEERLVDRRLRHQPHDLAEHGRHRLRRALRRRVLERAAGNGIGIGGLGLHLRSLLLCAGTVYLSIVRSLFLTRNEHAATFLVMPRLARVVIPSLAHHVTQRGNRRQPTFFCDDDYRTYRGLMAAGCAAAKVAVLAYCLMPNHVHLILVPADTEGLRRAVAESHRRYAAVINRRQNWRGHLWQERFHSCPLHDDHLLAAVRYVELNPVRAKLVPSAQDWQWSSAAVHLARVPDELVSPDLPPALNAVNCWSEFLSAGISPEVEARLRQHGRSGRPFGDEAFIARLEGHTARPLKRKRAGRKPRSTGSSIPNSAAEGADM